MSKRTIVFATNNANKLKEIRSLLEPDYKILGLDAIGCKEEVPETSFTLEGNAQQKANFITANYGVDCFADDTGLLVEALNGEPGIYSARYAGPQRNSEDNVNLLLKNLENRENRSAHFKTVIALNLNGEQHQFIGECHGEITKARKGNAGFGYDPVFSPSEYDLTFAQMTLDQKNKIGHRGKAVRALSKHLRESLLQKN